MRLFRGEPKQIFQRVSTPILMLSAHDEAEHRIRCLDAGADDFLAKQSRVGELLARVRALLRRPRSYEASELRVGELVLDTLARRARRGGRELDLTSRELAVLEILMRRPDRVFSRDELLETAWGVDFEGSSKVVDKCISRMRRKIDAGEERKLIETVREWGYRLRSPGPW